MYAKCLSQIAELAGQPVATVQQLAARGVIPKGDVKMGRMAYYSLELASAIERWLRESYVPYTRGQRFVFNKEEVK